MRNKTGEMKNLSRNSPSEPSFSDPATKPWVWWVYALLISALVPVWPIPGYWWGVPAWAVFAVLASALTSVFTAFVILNVWKDSPAPPSEKDSIHD